MMTECVTEVAYTPLMSIVMAEIYSIIMNV